MSYDKLVSAARIIKTEDINGVPHIPFYLKTSKEADFAKANLRMASKSGGRLKLNHESLEKIPIEKLTHEDMDMIEEGFEVETWVPKDKKKYAGWALKHDLGEGAVILRFAKKLTTASIEERRIEYANRTEKDGAELAVPEP